MPCALCPHCRQRRRITRKQWEKLKPGDYLVSPAGREREILSVTDSTVTFQAISWKTGRTTYTRTDLWNTYTVKKNHRREP